MYGACVTTVNTNMTLYSQASSHMHKSKLIIALQYISHFHKLAHSHSTAHQPGRFSQLEQSTCISSFTWISCYITNGGASTSVHMTITRDYTTTDSYKNRHTHIANMCRNNNAHSINTACNASSTCTEVQLMAAGYVSLSQVGALPLHCPLAWHVLSASPFNVYPVSHE